VGSAVLVGGFREHHSQHSEMTSSHAYIELGIYQTCFAGPIKNI